MKEDPNFSRLTLNKDLKKIYENLLNNRFYISKCFTSYKGPAGLYEFGPNGCKLKNNLINLWKKILTKEEKDIKSKIDFFEIQSSIILPYSVLKSSGHIDKFDDTLIYDLITGDAFRADHYLLEKNIPKEIKEKLEFLPILEINKILNEYNILSPEGNKMGNACKFNLMFKSNIGAKKLINSNYESQIFLRPETAQNQFLYLPKLLQYNSLPFATYSIGLAFRNEISPKNQLLRLREFEQAEIEYYYKNNNDIPMKLFNCKEIIKFVYYKKENEEYKQLIYKDTLFNAYKTNLIKNKIIIYFLGQSVIFLNKIGIKEFQIRQHRPDEMAHYANDCWDIEIWSTLLNCYIECIGIADRSSFDLKCHSKFDNFIIKENLNENEFKKRYEIKPKFNKKKLYEFSKEFEEKIILNKFNNLINEKIEEIRKECEINFKGKKKVLNKEIEFIFNNKRLNIEINFEILEKLITIKEYLPQVVEPSFGISRIIQMVLESSFSMRHINKPKCIHKEKLIINSNEEKYYLSLPVNLVPNKVFISFLKHSFYKNENYLLILNKIFYNLIEFNPKIINRNVNIGRKYISSDEQGTLLFITIDDDTENNNIVTIRCRECTNQIFSNINNIRDKVFEMISEFN